MSAFPNLIRKSAARAAFVASLGLFGCAQQTHIHGYAPTHRPPARPCPTISIHTQQPAAPKPAAFVAPLRIEVGGVQEVAAPKPSVPASEPVLVPAQQKPAKSRLDANDLEIPSGSTALRAAGSSES